MNRDTSTTLHASGHRFLVRRMEYALACRDTRMLDDPIRAQSLAFAAGAVLTVIAVGLCMALALIRPHGTVGSAPIVIERESGAIFVQVGDTLHPAMNLASARLIARTPATPVLVSAASIATAKRGPLMGIPGAPAAVPAVTSGTAAWTVCDGEETTVFVGAARDDPLAPPLLVRPAGESAAIVYLLYDGRRALVDLRDRVVVRALRLDGVEPLRLSLTALNLVPEVAPIRTPVIDNVGTPGPRQLPGSRVGSILQVHRADAAPDHYVVLPSGIQRVSPVAADLVRFAVAQVDPIREIPADRIANVPVVEMLPLQHLPQNGATPVGDRLTTPVCVRWTPRQVGVAPEVAVTTAKTQPPQTPLTLAQADGDGPHIDAVAITDGAYVHATGAAGTGAETGPLFFVDQAGVAYGVDGADTAHSLGLPDSPGSGPWPVLASLPRGPTLSVAGASVQRDGIPPPA
jgi:type VII secretion protein EccB